MGIEAAGEQGKTLGIDIIARQDTGSIPPEGAGRRLATSKGGFINHVIVEEGGRVDQLKAGGYMSVVFPLITKVLGPE